MEYNTPKNKILQENYSKIKKTSVISLIGMTGVGKTTVGKVLSEKLNFGFFDLDMIITEKTGKSPAEIFAVHGEEFFRQTETEELENIFENYNKNFILSCGGGIVLKGKNRQILKEKSFAVWLLRPIGEIMKNEEIFKRPPINNDINNYVEIFKRREKLYEETRDLKIEYTDISEAVENIISSKPLPRRPSV